MANGHGHADVLDSRLARIESLLMAAPRAGSEWAGREALPAWRRVTQGETRWAVTASVALVLVVQSTLPARLVVHPRPLLPAVEFALLACLVALNPHRIERRSAAYRALSLVFTAATAGANLYAAVRLAVDLVHGRSHLAAGALLLTGGGIWLVNVVVFALIYWELDRGGPVARAGGVRQVPDFLFPQMQAPELAQPDWEPAYFDYVYLSFTNSTAFSPTDVMPMTRKAKGYMLTQSAVSLVTVVLVVARAVNILG
ncbi:DUF1345 domain-containing protein [Actinacidiphila yeochonensis]|uniref:DUF1345 domain-containing protein n=1 Tax=Actinacidiphila yeochonensis TaxID=89050 RepID=UPI000561B198|nr:DUF1345 domain-containing protein [Actinacidiphila yeochonensis]